MLDLTSKIGLSAQIGDNNRLNFGADVDLEKMSVRTFSDLAAVSEEENLNLKDEPAYYMYRDVRRRGDEEKISSRGLRFDLTVIPPAKIGKEFVKTSGHYHPIKTGTDHSYPELYYVLAGQATYLLQKRGGENTVEEVILVRAKAGTLVVMPPDFGHVTINELSEPLVMANWVEGSFKSIYDQYEKLRGGAYYIKNNFGQPKIVPNPRYMNLPEIKEMKSNPLIFAEMLKQPIYDYLDSNKLESMVRFEDHMGELAAEKVFKSL